MLGGNTFENYDIPVPEEKHGHVWTDGWCSFCGATIKEGGTPMTEIDISVNNILMADIATLSYNDSGNHIIPPVFGSEILRTEIKTITFLDSVDSVPEKAWDVSEKNNGAVWAWVEPNGDLYNLYIAGQGGVVAPKNCEIITDAPVPPPMAIITNTVVNA